MDKFIIKNIIMLSLILGAILGLLAPIPYVGGVMLFAVLVLAAPIVVLYLIMDSKLDLTTPKDSIITGALIGFCSDLTFALCYSIVMVILAQGFHYTPNFFLTAMLTHSPVWLVLLFILFLGVLCATTNAFSGFATFYIINFIRDMYEKQHPDVSKQNNNYAEYK